MIDALCCPYCRGNLTADKPSALSCKPCGKEFRIELGIPRFVASDHYVSNFSLEWKIHRKTQLDEGKEGLSAFHFHTRFGQDKAFWAGKRVLDAGVGTGRYAKVALENGAEVWGADLSYSIEVARENLARYPKVQLVQADIFRLPFPDNFFDVIYSFGVLHHTPDPRQAFQSLLRHLKPGGVICITVYPNYGMYHTSKFVRSITTKMPPVLLYPITTGLTCLLYVPYKYLGFRYGILGRAFPISLSSNFREAILDTFDCYSPKYQFTYANDEIFTWFKEAGLQNIEVRPHPVTMLGYAPVNVSSHG